MHNRIAIFRPFQLCPFSFQRSESRALWDTPFCTLTSECPFPSSNRGSPHPRLSVDHCGSTQPRGMGVVSPLCGIPEFEGTQLVVWSSSLPPGRSAAKSLTFCESSCMYSDGRERGLVCRQSLAASQSGRALFPGSPCGEQGLWGTPGLPDAVPTHLPDSGLIKARLPLIHTHTHPFFTHPPATPSICVQLERGWGTGGG